MASRRVRFRALLIAVGVVAVLLGAARAVVGVAKPDGAGSPSVSGDTAEATVVLRSVAPGTGVVTSTNSRLTSPDVPLPPGDYALALEGGPPGEPSDVLAAAARQYPGFVTDRSILRFLTIGNNTPNNHRAPMPTWVVVTPDVYAPSLGPANQRFEAKMAASYAWVFLDPDGTVIGATIIGYRDAVDVPPLPAP